MKALIIGGNRFFGRRLAARLLEHKADVTLLNRQTLDDGFGERVKRIKCDRTDKHALKAAMANQEWDIVFDQVCYDADEARAAVEIFENKTKRYIFTSTQSVYEGGGMLKESVYEPMRHSFNRTADPKTQYGEAKRQCEAVFFQESDLNLAAVRFPFVLGEDDYTKRLHFHVEHIKHAKPFYVPNLKAETSLIHAQDAADALFVLGTTDYKGPINCASPEAISMGQLIELIELKTGKKALLQNEPAPGLDSSPYGRHETSTMDVSKAQSIGLRFQPLNRWLPQLIESINKIS